MEELGALIGRALTEPPSAVAPDVTAFREKFQTLHFIRS